jgi:hypothetical protein
MNRRIVLALVGALVTTASIAPASAQRYVMRQPIKQLKSTASTTAAATPPATPKTLVCSNLQMGRTSYPEQDAQYVTSAATPEAAFAACNQIGVQYGEIFKAYGYCKVAKAAENTWYAYLVKATGVYEYTDAYSKSIIGLGTCTYNP